jgi:hypothetical protein
MARVPVVTGPSVAPTALPAAFQTSNAGLASFGGTQADSLISSGAQLQGAGDTLSDLALKIQNDDNDRELKGLEARWRTQLLEINYGDGESPGFYQLRGQTAVDAEGATRERIEALRSQLLSGASNSAVRDVFNDFSLQARDSEYEVAFRFTMGERIVANDDATAARVGAVLNQVAVDPSYAQEALGVIHNEADSMAKTHGWGEEVTDQWRTDQVDLMVNAMINGALSRRQPDQAVTTLDQYGPLMSGRVRAETAASLEQITLAAGADTFVDNLETRYGTNYDAMMDAVQRELTPGAVRGAAEDEIIQRMNWSDAILRHNKSLMDVSDEIESEAAEDAALPIVVGWESSGITRSEAQRMRDDFADNRIVWDAYNVMIDRVYGSAATAENEDTVQEAQDFIDAARSEGDSDEQILAATSGAPVGMIAAVQTILQNNRVALDAAKTAQVAEASDSFMAYLGDGSPTLDASGKPVYRTYEDWISENMQYSAILTERGLVKKFQAFAEVAPHPVVTQDAGIDYQLMTLAEIQEKGKSVLIDAKPLLSEGDYNVFRNRVLEALAETGITPVTSGMVETRITDLFNEMGWELTNNREKMGWMSTEIHRQVQNLTESRMGSPVTPDDLENIIDGLLSKAARDSVFGRNRVMEGLMEEDQFEYELNGVDFEIEASVYANVRDVLTYELNRVPNMASESSQRRMLEAQLYYDLYNITPSTKEEWGDAKQLADEVIGAEPVTGGE